MESRKKKARIAKEDPGQDEEPPSKRAKTTKKPTSAKKPPADADEDEGSNESWISDESEESADE